MKVLLISTNRSRVMVPPFPLGLAYVAANVEKHGHEVSVWDAMFCDEWEPSLRRRLREFGPQVVGLSVRNVDDQDMRAPQFFLEEVKRMVAVCREESDATIVAGGAGFGMFADEVLTYLDVDFGIVGDGEKAFNMLLDRLEARTAPNDVPGLVWRDGQQTRVNSPEWSEHLDDLAFPDRDRLDAARYYETQGEAKIPNTATVQTKRGCPLSCAYCATSVIEGNKLRLRSPKAVAAEIEGLVKLGMHRVQFVDSIFTNPEWHAEAVCQELLKRRLDVQWSSLVNPAFASQGLLRLMKQAGCELAIVGNESGCTRVLKQLRKGFGKQDVERCFAALRAEGMRYNAFLLLGGPGEDRASVEESVELMERFAPSQVSVTVGIRLYPHCDLTRLAEEEELLQDSTSLLPPKFYLSPALKDWIWDYLEPVMHRHPNWVI